MLHSNSFTHKIIHHIGTTIGSGFGSGLSPVMSGTAGSLLAIIIYAVSPIESDSLWALAIIMLGIVLGIWACNTLVTESDKDPKKAVWDEFIGMWITCLFLPKETLWLIAAFICFRVLDITKPYPARKLEGLHGGLGIMADDILVGIYGAIILNIIQVALS